LKRVFAKPAPTDIRWADIEAMMRGAGVDIKERAASRVALVEDGEVMVVQRPHPEPLTVRATVHDIAAFLKAVGVRP
jgi:hypothetical protein